MEITSLENKELPTLDTQPDQQNSTRYQHAQKIRTQRFLLGWLSYGAGSVVVFFLVLNDYLSLENYLYFIGLMMTVNGLLFACFKSEYNLKFDDPSLTGPQILLATLILTQVTYTADGGRGVLLLLYLTSHIFGVFKLNLRQFLVIDIITIIAYGVVILLLVNNRPEAIDLKLELLHWAALIIILPSFAGIGAYLNTLRSRLHDRNLRLNKALDRIQELADTDELTGLFNRRYVVEALRTEKERAEQIGGTFSIALMDLDLFKRINDTFGHLAGDSVLKQFSKLASGVLRTTDVLGRYGGEEFLIVMPNTDLQSANGVVERIRALAAMHEYKDLEIGLYVQVSIGVAECEPGQTIEVLLNTVDRALYCAKNTGRNRVALSK